jgi:D-2-hydroxyglutarate dehydrogenase
VPHGGNTGLAGGSVPVYDEVVLSLQRMNDVVSVDNDSGTAVVQAGVTLKELDDALEPHGLTVPLDLGVRATCQLGGNVSTNAGGLRVVRYGSLHGSVLGLEVVTADGRVLDMLSCMRKDNTGLDLKQLFVGAEGTLGVITKVAISAPPRPASVNVAFLGVRSFTSVLATLRRARRMLGEILSAAEFEDATCMRLVLQHLEGARHPLAHARECPMYMVIETAGSCAEHDTAKLEAFVAASRAEGDVLDATVATDAASAEQLWRLRYGVSQALVKAGFVFKYDVSIPQAKFYSLVEEIRARLAADEARGGMACTEVVGYGHVGDGNLHVNVLYDRHASEAQQARTQQVLEPWIFEQVAQLRGSVSAEHGIGQHKIHALRYSKSDAAVQLMRDIKRLLDPKGLLNPYKVYPDKT